MSENICEIFSLIKIDFYQKAIFQNIFSNLLYRRNCLKLKIISNQEKSYTENHRNFERWFLWKIKDFEQRNLQSCFQIVTLAIEGVLAEDADVSMPI